MQKEVVGFEKENLPRVSGILVTASVVLGATVMAGQVHGMNTATAGRKTHCPMAIDVIDGLMVDDDS